MLWSGSHWSFVVLYTFSQWNIMLWRSTLFDYSEPANLCVVSRVGTHSDKSFVQQQSTWTYPVNLWRNCQFHAFLPEPTDNLPVFSTQLLHQARTFLLLLSWDFNEQMGANYSKFAISHQITFAIFAISHQITFAPAIRSIFKTDNVFIWAKRCTFMIVWQNCQIYQYSQFLFISLYENIIPVLFLIS